MNTTTLLQSKKLRLTKPRITVLEFFQAHIGKAISIKELLDSFSEDIDKVTLYRTLHTFEDSGLIHRIFDDTALEKYALCIGTCDDHQGHDDHSHSHIHFKCEKCQETDCIADFKLPEIKLPQGYQSRSTNFIILGFCPKCS